MNWSVLWTMCCVVGSACKNVCRVCVVSYELGDLGMCGPCAVDPGV